ncbi:hypothetical protein [Streptosporangium sp. NPDC051022]|uniref:hypothetical protein n=1 Tax=Streptosporangium sp. NPDC051022 TaxID=3155752 RepID=UPI003440ABB6
MTITHAYAATVTKAERDAAGSLIVYGKATGPDVDLDAQICDPAWLKTAMPKWMTWGNLREMHQPIAAGIGIELAAEGDDWMLKSKVVDEGTAKKIEAGALKGYSVGIKNAQVVKDTAAPGGRIVGGEIVEVSYVDRPCNPTATLALTKAATSGELAPVDAEGHVLDVEKREQETVTIADLAKVVGELVTVVKSSLPAPGRDGGVEGSGEGGGAGAGSATRPEVDTTAAPDLSKSEIADLVKAAVAEATKPLEERAKTLEAELAKVKQQPVPGGPVIRPTTPTTAQQGEQNKGAYYRAMANEVQDPEARRGYLQLAADAERGK